MTNIRTKESNELRTVGHKFQQSESAVEAGNVPSGHESVSESRGIHFFSRFSVGPGDLPGIEIGDLTHGRNEATQRGAV